MGADRPGDLAHDHDGQLLLGIDSEKGSGGPALALADHEAHSKGISVHPQQELPGERGKAVRLPNWSEAMSFKVMGERMRWP